MAVANTLALIVAIKTVAVAIVIGIIAIGVPVASAGIARNMIIRVIAVSPANALSAQIAIMVAYAPAVLAPIVRVARIVTAGTAVTRAVASATI